MAHFSPTNHLVTCRTCHTLTHSEVNNIVGLDLCLPCYNQATAEIEHFDQHYSAATYSRDCTFCHAEGRFPQASLG